MFDRMLSAFGIGGPSVDTVLDSPHAVPGRPITGQVRIEGGSSDTEISEVVLSLVTQAEHDDVTEFLRLVVQQGLRVPAGQLVSIPFQLPLPWETPITAVDGTALPGSIVGVRTELIVAGAPDTSDLDSVLVDPLPSQNKVLDAFGQLGFSFRGTGVEAGRQELEFLPPAQFAGRVSQVELAFVADQHELHVILQADGRRGGGTTGHLRLSHQEALVTDWVAAVSGWLCQVAERGRDDHDQQGQRRGPGMLAAGAAGGVLGGLALSGVADELFGDDEG
ncbi:sporulation protein [Lentzea nigeriaca]|uniref:sporulation protein n=1 Tax=Lentzea nigeriaca TaxID=1128665 RepID=UPI00195EACB9|nr:sporulation protein [Lentzea nigeriaca]MBM7861017.1 sporulation-control protein [Lentzea nigeriaca]